MKSFLQIVVLILISMTEFQMNDSYTISKSEIITYAEAASKKEADFVEDNYALALQTFAFLLGEQKAEAAVCVVLDNVNKDKGFLITHPFLNQKDLFSSVWIDSQPMVYYEDNLWINIQYQDVYTLKRLLI